MNGRERKEKHRERKTILRENEVCKEQKWMELLNAVVFASNYCFIIFPIFTIIYLSLYFLCAHAFHQSTS